MRDALTIVNERMAAARKEAAIPDARIDQKELLKLLSPQLYEDAMNFKQEFGYLRVLNARAYYAVPSETTTQALPEAE